MKEFTIQVFKHGTVGADNEHIVQISGQENGQTIGQVQFPTGDYENARYIAEGFAALSDGGFDLSQLIQNEE